MRKRRRSFLFLFLVLLLRPPYFRSNMRSFRRIYKEYKQSISIYKQKPKQTEPREGFEA